MRFQTRTESGYNFDTGEFIGQPLQLNLNDPRNTDRPSPWHRDHNFVTGWTWLLPKTGIAGSATEGVHLRLSGSAHDAEAHDGLAVLGHEGGDDGVKRTLPGCVGIEMSLFQIEELTAVLKDESQSIGRET